MRRQRVGPRHHRIAQTREKPHQRRLHEQHDPRTARAQQFRIAHELDRVAQPLFGVEQHRPAGNLRGPVPVRIIELRHILAKLRHPPPRLVGSPTPAKIAHAEQRQRLAQPRLHLIGIEFHGTAKPRNRFRRAPQRQMRAAKIIGGLRVIRPRRECRLEIRNRLRRPVQCQQRRADIVPRPKILRPQDKRAPIAHDRLGIPPLAAHRIAQIIQRRRMIRPSRQCVAVARLRLHRLATAQQRVAQVIMQFRIFRPQRHGRTKLPHRLHETPAPA